MSILDKIKKNSTIKDSAILSKSKFFESKDMISTSIPILNIAFSADIDGGMIPGLTTFAGPSKHFKTGFSLVCAKAYMDKYPESAMLFYDSEFGSPQSYFTSHGIDTERVIHTPLTDIEQLKFDIMAQLSEITRGDKLIIVIDSIGNLASKKEIDDAVNGNSASDMTRAKQMKSLFRMVTPHLNLKDIPMIVINHTYKTMELYSKDVVGGGTGSIYSSDTIFIIGRQQDKDKNTKEIDGYDFILNVEKSRYVKEKSKFTVSVGHDSGIDKYSGLLELAIDSGHVIKPQKGWYQSVDDDGVVSEKSYREKDLQKDFWEPIMTSEKFKNFIKNKYSIGSSSLYQEDIKD